MSDDQLSPDLPPPTPEEEKTEIVDRFWRFEKFMDDQRRLIEVAVGDKTGLCHFIGHIAVPVMSASGPTGQAIPITFEIPASSLMGAFAKFDEAAKAAVAELNKPKIEVPGIGPAFKPRNNGHGMGGRMGKFFG